MTADALRRTKVACPTQVATIPSPAGAGGTGCGTTSTCLGQGTGRLVIFHLIRSRRPRSELPSPGLKKVFPLKWSDSGNVIGLSL